MARLSSPFEELKSHYEIVVVGSGYGGGITASRMARAGREVCLLERGKEFQPGEFDKEHNPIKHGEYPDTEAEVLREVQFDFPLSHKGPRTGLYDFRINEDISVFLGCGLGGTSLVNANVALKADPRVFELPEWPEEFRKNPTLLVDGYAHAREMLRSAPYPDDTRPSEFPQLAKLNALKKCADEWNEPFYRPPINVNFDTLEDNLNHVGVEQHPCVGCGDCMTGCNYRAKNTVLMNYLPDARNHGAEIFTQVSVRYVSRSDNRWVVHYQRLSNDDQFDPTIKSLTADIVVLAAGCLGSTEILLRSKSEGLSLSNQVGEKFSGNGDFLGFAYNCDEEINGIGFGHHPPIEDGVERQKVGPSITGIIDLRDKEPVEQGYLIEEGSVAGPLGGLLPGVLSSAAALLGQDTDSGFRDETKERAREVESLVRGPYRGAVRNTQLWLTMCHEHGRGQMRLEDDRLRIHWPGVGNEPIFRTVEDKQTEATAILGGTYLQNPVANKIAGEDIVTVHPLGGCVMADSAATGVVNHKGQVFSGTEGAAIYDSLYVSDGAVIPRPLGVNPLFTISAVAERACVLMAQDRGWKFEYDLPSKPLKPEALIMSAQSKPGVSFNETMTGGFSLGETDPRTGEQKGDAAGTPLSFHCDIQIQDVYAFMEDPQHASPMNARIDFAPLGMNIPTTNGIFNLLRPGDDPKTKYLIYEAAFEHNGEPYYLAGKKYVHDDLGFDMWDDITTLFTLLHKSKDASGPVVGAGVIYIKREQLKGLIPTFQATNTSSAAESAKVLADFGRFFMGEIEDLY